MYISNYLYEVGTELVQDHYQLLDDREVYMATQYLSRFGDKLAGLELDGRVAVLYVGGNSSHNSEDRNYNGTFTCSQAIRDSGVVIKNLQSYNMHKYIGMMPCKDRVVYANINSNTCASSMYAIYEAQGLIDSGKVDYVIVIAEEKTSFNTIRIFKEHRIDVTPGEGFACVVLGREGKYKVSDAKWAFAYDKNPFLVKAQGYEMVNSEADVVKGHKTGTVQNDGAEAEVFGDTIGYKDKVGHCQGASGLIETCMVLDDDNVAGNVLCVASGLGGFYGSFVVSK